jgi:hypothetical protein
MELKMIRSFCIFLESFNCLTIPIYLLGGKGLYIEYISDIFLVSCFSLSPYFQRTTSIEKFKLLNEIKNNFILLSNTLSNESFSGLKLAHAYIILYLILLIRIEVTIWSLILRKYFRLKLYKVENSFIHFN